jgi:DNA-binding transcriptional MerR regulator
MSYFYPMQMQQLDLFGMPVEAPASPARKQKAAPKAAIPAPEPVAVPEPEAIAPVGTEPEPVQEPVAAIALPVVPEPQPIIAAVTPEPVSSEPVVFADERIVVKIKAKTVTPPAPPKPVAVTKPAPAVTEVPVVARTAGKRGRKSFREIDTELDLVDVPDEEILKQKLYYSISEVAGWFKVNTSLLRYWENEFDILQPRKTRKGDRLFRVEDIKNLQLIYFLLRQRKFSIEGARNYLKQNRNQADKQAQLVQSLSRFKSFLLELKANLGN